MSAARNFLALLLVSTHSADAVNFRSQPRLDNDNVQPEVLQRFQSFMKQYGRTYQRGSEEYARRLVTFAARAKEADEHNAKPGLGWTAGINEFSDWNEEELKKLRGVKGAHRRSADDRVSLLSTASAVHHALNESAWKESVSWAHLKAVQNTVAQGACGSCWAVSTATVLGAYAELYGSPRTFSIQQLLSCVDNPDQCGGGGQCDGATAELAMQYAQNIGEMFTEELWQYEGVATACDAKYNWPSQNDGLSSAKSSAQMNLHGGAARSKFGMTNYMTLPENKYAPVMEALQRGPVVISVAAGSHWNSYQNGIYDPAALCAGELDPFSMGPANSCNENVINHAVTLYGYGSEKEKGYWLVKNSWGPDWGEGGSIKIARGGKSDEARCETDPDPLKGTGCAQGVHKAPRAVKICGVCGILYDVTVPEFEAVAST